MPFAAEFRNELSRTRPFILHPMNALLTTTTAPSTRPSSSSSGRKPRILLADDSPQIRESLSKLLRNEGYHVVTAANGNHVLDRLMETEIELILLDLNMPGMDGWETLDHLAHLRPSLPVFVITAQPHQREWAQAEGARLLMEKPLDLPLLLDRIRNCIQSPSAPSRETTPGIRFSAEEKSDFRFADRYRGWGTD